MHRATLLALFLLLSLAVPASAQSLLPLGAAQWVGAQPNSRDSDTAFNDKQRVYLTVWGHPKLYGRFIASNGVPLGAGPFVISEQSASDASPRVAYSGGSADDVFLVTYTSELGTVQQYMRSVRYTSAGPQLGPVQPLSHLTGVQHLTGGLVFNPTRRQFFCTWHSNGGSGLYQAFGQAVQVSGDSANPTMTALGTPTNISQGGTDLGTPNVAYDWKHDSYMVIYWASNGSGLWARVVNYDTAANLQVGPAFEVTTSAAPLEPNIVYMPEADAFLAFWTILGGWGRDVMARTIDHGGTTGGSVFPVIMRSSNEGAADADYSPYTRTILLTAMRDSTMLIEGAELTAAGVFVRDFGASTSVPAPGMESLWPHTAVGEDGKFGLSYINNFTNVWLDILQGPVVAGGAFAYTPPPPPLEPPPPTPTLPTPTLPAPALPTPCTSAVYPAALTMANSGGAATVGVTGTCTWTAASAARWIVVLSGGSGTGDGTVGIWIARNTSTETRTGTLTVAGQTVTISQPGYVVRPAVHDMTGDALSDLLWHNSVTGQIAIWQLNGPTVVATRALNGGVPVDPAWKPKGAGDLNGDGAADVVWRHINGTLAAWMMQGTTPIATQVLKFANGATAVQADPNWHIRGIGDLNGDGTADLIWQNDSGSLAAWMMDGFTVLETGWLSVGFVGDRNWQVMAAGDINADGRADIVWQHLTTGALAAWLMDGRQVVATQFLSLNTAHDLNWRIRGLGDVNGDGYADVLWHHANGSVAVWYLNGFRVIYTRFLSIYIVPDTTWTVVGPG